MIEEGGKNPKWKDQEFTIIISSLENIDSHQNVDGFLDSNPDIDG